MIRWKFNSCSFIRRRKDSTRTLELDNLFYKYRYEFGRSYEIGNVIRFTCRLWRTNRSNLQRDRSVICPILLFHFFSATFVLLWLWSDTTSLKYKSVARFLRFVQNTTVGNTMKICLSSDFNRIRTEFDASSKKKKKKITKAFRSSYRFQSLKFNFSAQGLQFD